MDDLIIRSFRDELSELEERGLQQWRSASAENEEHYQILLRLWRIEPPTGLTGSAPRRPALDRIVREAERRRGVGTPPRPGSLMGPRWGRRSAAIAASIAIMFGAVKLLPDREPINPLGAAEFVTGARETATVTLTDGTIVRLAPGSRLRLPTGGVTRDVWLDGQAYFAVKSDSARPFIVRTQAGDATVLGTRFELRTREDELRLVVVEGRVALEAGGEKVEVGADEVSHVKDGAGPSLARVDNVHELLDWTEGLLIFQSTPITQVSRELARHFGVSIEIQDSRIADRKVTGWFTDETLDEVLIAICRASGIDCTLEGDTVRIRAPGQ